MTSIIQKALLAAALLTSAALIQGCVTSGASSAPSKTYTDKLVVGSGGLLPMWTQQSGDTSKDGGLEGFDVDMMKEICRRNNWELEWRIADFSALWGMLDNGTIDTIANETTSNKQRLEKYDFSMPYASESYVFAVPKGSHPGSIDWFKGKKVCVQGTSNPRLVLEDMNEEKHLNLDIGYMDVLSSLWPSVQNGQYDAAFSLRSSVLIVMNDLKMDFDMYDPNYKAVPIMYAFTKTEKNQKRVEAINKTIDAMRKDGTIKTLSEKWFKKDLSTLPDGLKKE